VVLLEEWSGVTSVQESVVLLVVHQSREGLVQESVVLLEEWSGVTLVQESVVQQAWELRESLA
jgi:hypothetical protein